MKAPTLYCPNCTTEFASNFCPNCGQRRVEGPYTWAEIRRDLMEKVLGLERGLFRTFIDLSLRPGKTVQDYLGGIRKRYTTPLTYYTLALALLVAVMQFVKMEEKTTQIANKQFEVQIGKPMAEMTEKQRKEAELTVKITAWVWHNFRYINMVLVPIYAFAWLLATWKMPYSFLETLILSLFLSAHIGVFQALCHLPMFWLDGENAFVLISSITGIGGVIYNYWALKQFYRTSWLKTLFIYILGFTIVIVFMSVVGGVVGASIALSQV